MPIACAQCSLPLALAGDESPLESTCLNCGSRNQVHVFPALALAPAATPAQAALEGEGACFDHPSKRAAGVCAQCGRYVCALCLVAFGGETLCPSCVAARSGRAGAANLEPARKLYDSLAFLLSLAPLALWPLTLITAPAAVFLSILRWREPLSLVRRNRWRFVAAMLCAFVQIGGWTWLIAYLIVSARAGSLSGTP